MMLGGKRASSVGRLLLRALAVPRWGLQLAVRNSNKRRRLAASCRLCNDGALPQGANTKLKDVRAGKNVRQQAS